MSTSDQVLTAPKNIWILEDDEQLRFLYQKTLTDHFKETCRLVFFTSIGEFLSEITKLQEVRNAFYNQSDKHKTQPDLILLDLQLPDGSMLKYLSQNSQVSVFLRNYPTIVVSYIDDIDAMRVCFEEGSFDYLIKPFKKNELIGKMERIFDINRELDYRPGGILEHLKKRSEIGLTLKESEILSLFLKSPEYRLKRQDLVDKVWESKMIRPKTLDVHLFNLRKKINQIGLTLNSDGDGVWVLKER